MAWLMTSGQRLVRSGIAYGVNSRWKGLFHSSALLGLTQEQRERLRMLGRGPTPDYTPAQLILQEDAFSTWNYRQVLAVFKEPNDWDTEDFDFARHLNEELLELAQKQWRLQLSCCDISPASNEAPRLRLIDAVLIVVPLHTKNTNRELIIRHEVELYHDDSASHGPVDYSIGDKRYRKHYHILVEAKSLSMQQGVAQNMLQLECASKIMGGASVFGVVTTGYTWSFLSYHNRNFHQSKEFHVDTDLDKIVAMLCWMANQGVEPVAEQK